jgi:hypothetical protein
MKQNTIAMGEDRGGWHAGACKKMIFPILFLTIFIFLI